MVFFSQLVGREILDTKADVVGVLKDLVMDFSKKFPTVAFLVVKTKAKPLKKLSWRFVESLEKTGVFLNTSAKEVDFQELDDKDVLLEDVVLDQQVVDINGLKVVRVNDIVLEKIDNDFCFSAIDIGFKGILRRLGLGRLNTLLLSNYPPNLVAWENVDTLHLDIKNLQLKIPQQKLASLHPADIARLMENLSHKERALMFKSLDSEIAADIIEESHPKIQKSVIRYLKKEGIIKLLETMAPDEAADLLAMLPKDKAATFLESMDQAKAAVIRNILKYDQDVAGGIMTKEYITVPLNTTVEQARELLRKNHIRIEHLHNLYVVDPAGHLLGVVSMKDIIVNSSETRLDGIMRKRVFFVNTDAEVSEILKLFRKYDLISLPVINNAKIMVGLITSDDILDLVLTKKG